MMHEVRLDVPTTHKQQLQYEQYYTTELPYRYDRGVDDD